MISRGPRLTRETPYSRNQAARCSRLTRSWPLDLAELRGRPHGFWHQPRIDPEGIVVRVVALPMGGAAARTAKHEVLRPACSLVGAHGALSRDHFHLRRMIVGPGDAHLLAPIAQALPNLLARLRHLQLHPPAVADRFDHDNLRLGST